MNTAHNSKSKNTANSKSKAEKPRVEVDRRAALKLASDAYVDLRTAYKALRGEDVGGLAGERIRGVQSGAR